MPKPAGLWEETPAAGRRNDPCPRDPRTCASPMRPKPLPAPRMMNPTVRAQDEHLPQDHATPPQLRYARVAQSPSTLVVNTPLGEEVAVGMNRPVHMAPQEGGGNQMVIHRALSSQGASFQRVSRDGELPTPCQCRSRSARVYPCGGRASAIPVMDVIALTAMPSRETLVLRGHRGAAWPRITQRVAVSPYPHLSFHDVYGLI
jgi:hypothetical protein